MVDDRGAQDDTPTGCAATAAQLRDPQHRGYPDVLPRRRKTFLERRKALGNTTTEALRALKRRLSDAVYRDLVTDAQTTTATCLANAA
jgi:hypothetical protein